MLRPWGLRKPVGPLRIDWSNPLTRGLVGAWAFNEDGVPRDLTGFTPLGARVGAPSLKTGVYGLSSSSLSTTAYYDHTGLGRVPLARPFTAILGGNSFSAASAFNLPLGVGGTSGGWMLAAEAPVTSGKIGVTFPGVADVESALATPADGGYFGASCGPSNVVFAVNGRLDINANTSAVGGISGTAHFAIGTAWRFDVASYGNGAEIGLVLLFAAHKTPADMALLTTDPWQIFVSSSVLAVKAPAAGGATVGSGLITGLKLERLRLVA